MKRNPTKDEFEQDIQQLKQAVEPLDRFLSPDKGYIRTIREWQGSSARAFAARMGMKAQSVRAIEKSEQKGRIRLDTLGRAANALNCTLIYALIPNSEVRVSPAAVSSPLSQSSPDISMFDETLRQLEASPELAAVAAEWAKAYPKSSTRSKPPK